LSFHAMPALSHSTLVSGWPERSAASGLGVVLADSDADPQTLALSFHWRFAVSQSMRVKGCVEMGSACAWLATAMPMIAKIRAENFTSSPREGWRSVTQQTAGCSNIACVTL
jgi:hypothetical protein